VTELYLRVMDKSVSTDLRHCKGFTHQSAYLREHRSGLLLQAMSDVLFVVAAAAAAAARMAAGSSRRAERFNSMIRA
jgi:hypothetical protein